MAFVCLISCYKTLCGTATLHLAFFFGTKRDGECFCARQQSFWQRFVALMQFVGNRSVRLKRMVAGDGASHTVLCCLHERLPADCSQIAGNILGNDHVELNLSNINYSTPNRVCPTIDMFITTLQ